MATFDRVIQQMKEKEEQDEKPKKEVFNPDWNVLGKEVEQNYPFYDNPREWEDLVSFGALDKWIEERKQGEAKNWQDQGDEREAQGFRDMDKWKFMDYIKKSNRLKDDKETIGWLLKNAKIDWPEFAKPYYRSLPYQELKEQYEEQYPEWFK